MRKKIGGGRSTLLGAGNAAFARRGQARLMVDLVGRAGSRRRREYRHECSRDQGQNNKEFHFTIHQYRLPRDCDSAADWKRPTMPIGRITVDLSFGHILVRLVAGHVARQLTA